MKVVPLTRLANNQKGIVSYIRAGQRASQRLADLGLTPGTEVEVVERAAFCGPVVVRVRGTMLAIGWGLASKVFVTPVEKKN